MKTSLTTGLALLSFAALAGVAAPASAQQKLLPAQSQITFVSKQMGVPVEGKFKKFDAQVVFDPKKPEAAKIALSIDLGSVALGVAETEAELAKPDWFAIKQFPQATFQSSAVKQSAPGKFDVAGKLSIKGVSHDVVVPVNLRCFSPQWDLHPAWQFEQELEIIDAFVRHGQPIAAINDVVEEPGFFRDYDASAVTCPLSRFSTAGDFRRLVHSVPDSAEQRHERAREIFNFHYACPVSKDHRKLRDLVRCVQILARLQCRTLVYLTPINVDGGTGLAGAEWRSALGANASTVLAALGEAAGPQLKVCDWSEALAAEYFFHEDLATEHLNQRGRAALAKRIAAQLPPRGRA